MNGYFRRNFLENHLLIALGVALLAFALYEIRQVLVVVFISYLLTAAITPAVDQLVSRGVQRWMAVLVAYFVFIAGLLILVLPLVPFFVQQVRGLFESLPFYLSRTSGILGLDPEGVDLNAFLRSEVEAIGRNLVSLTSRAFSGVFSAVAIFVLPLYFLLDKEKLSGGIASLFGREKEEVVKKIFSKVDLRLGDWSRGQAVLSLVIGMATWVALTVLGIPFALPLALLAGILEVVPTIGPVLSAVPAVIVALTISPTQAIFTVGAYIIIQMLENNLLVPKIMEKAVGLNPVVVILGVMTGGQLMGIVGALLAVPFILVVSVIASEIRREKAEK